MTARMRRNLAYLNGAVLVALAAARVITGLLSFDAGGSLVALGNDLIRATIVILFAFLAGILIVRRPENVLGPFLSIIALLLAVEAAAEGYARYGILYAGSPPLLATFAAWLQNWIWILSQLPLLTLLFLLFPDGRLPSERWRPVLPFVVAVLLLLAGSYPFQPGAMDDRYDTNGNPFGIDSIGPLLEVLSIAGMALLVPAVSLSMCALLTRFRRSTGIERLQLKWFATAAALVLLLFGPSMAIYLATLDAVVWEYWIAASPALVFFAASIAILRYRLYDIDKIINRTVVYSILTTTLGLTYLSLVLSLQALLRPLNEGSDLAIAVTTLVVAALFLPARRRVQEMVARRFNRRAYDAARTMDEFGARLRQQVDLDTLCDDLLSVVDETMAPVNATLWLRPNR